MGCLEPSVGLLPTEVKEPVGGQEVVPDRPWVVVVWNDPVAGRLAALDTLEATADAPTLDENQMEAWMRAINDTRLLLGTRLAVTEDRAGREVPDDHPDAQAIAVYDYLSWLEEQLVEAL